jgi:hypothetical protein
VTTNAESRQVGNQRQELAAGVTNDVKSPNEDFIRLWWERACSPPPGNESMRVRSCEFPVARSLGCMTFQSRLCDGRTKGQFESESFRRFLHPGARACPRFLSTRICGVETGGVGRLGRGGIGLGHQSNLRRSSGELQNGFQSRRFAISCHEDGVEDRLSEVRRTANRSDGCGGHLRRNVRRDIRRTRGDCRCRRSLRSMIRRCATHGGWSALRPTVFGTVRRTTQANRLGEHHCHDRSDLQQPDANGIAASSRQANLWRDVGCHKMQATWSELFDSFTSTPMAWR